MPGCVTITAPPRARHVELSRSGEVTDGAWLDLRAELGADGREVGRGFRVPVERFLTRLSRLRDSTRRHGISLDWQGSAEQLVAAQVARRQALRQARQATAALSHEEVDELLDGSRFRRGLRDFQRRDLARLLALDSGANFSVPGAGKTTVTYALYEAERRRGRVERLLVVAPLSAFEAWQAEAKACFTAPGPRLCLFDGYIPPGAEILVVNYQRLHSAYDLIARWLTQAPTMAVLDEAHRIKKGWRGRWGTDSLSLAVLAARRDILTGTPAPQGPRDMVSLLDFVWPSSAHNIVPPGTAVNQPTRAGLAAIADAIAPLFVRTTKQELGLRPPDMELVPVPLEPLHAAIYEALRDQYHGTLSVDRIDRRMMAQIGQITMYLLEAATNPALLAAGSSSYDPREFRHPPLRIAPGSRLAELLANYGQYAMPRKFSELLARVARNAEVGRKTLVWTNFVRNIETLDRLFAALEPAVIHGGVPQFAASPGQRNRDEEIRRFRRDSDCMVLIANPAATSEGISLHDVCHDAIYLDRTFNAGQYLQSLDRIHRLGLAEDEETRITLLVSENTIDEVVNRRVEQKASRLSQMLSDPSIVEMALPDDEDFGQPIDTQEDLAALLAHLRGEPVA